MGSLQLNRGNLADKPTLKEGEAYLAQDKNVLVAKVNGVDQHFHPAFKNADIKVVTASIPAIPAATRQEVTIDLGTLNNGENAIISFFKQIATAAEIQKRSSEDFLPLVYGSRDADLAGTSFGNYTLINSDTGPVFAPLTNNTLLVSKDYLKTKRFFHTNVLVEYINDGSSQMQTTDFTYEDKAVGVLVGWYTTAGTGVLGVDKKVQMESAWLEDGLDGKTNLVLALYNTDVDANSVLDFKVAVFE